MGVNATPPRSLVESRAELSGGGGGGSVEVEAEKSGSVIEEEELSEKSVRASSAEA